MRKRKEDLSVLIDLFVNNCAAKYHKVVEPPQKKIKKWMMEYDWPGNVRELQNVIERYVVMRDLPEFSIKLLQVDTNQNIDSGKNSSKEITVTVGTLPQMEKQIIEQLLCDSNYNKTKVAAVLGISRSTLWYKTKHMCSHYN